MATYMRAAERKALARRAARELLSTGTPFQDLSLRAVSEHLGWSLGTLHRAYSIMAVLLNDLLLAVRGRHGPHRVPSGGSRARRRADGRAHALRAWMADPAHQQLVRCQMSLAARSEIPLELMLQHTRGTSLEFHREVLVTIGAAAGEGYSDLDTLAALVAGFRDGLTFQYFAHGDLDRWLGDNLAAIALVVAFAKPRRARTRTAVADRRWVAD